MEASIRFAYRTLIFESAILLTKKSLQLDCQRSNRSSHAKCAYLAYPPATLTNKQKSLLAPLQISGDPRLTPRESGNIIDAVLAALSLPPILSA